MSSSARAAGGDARRYSPAAKEQYVSGADMVNNMEGNTDGRAMRAPERPGVVEDPGMCGRSLRGNREILGLAGEVLPVRIGKARSHSR